MAVLNRELDKLEEARLDIGKQRHTLHYSTKGFLGKINMFKEKMEELKSDKFHVSIGIQVPTDKKED